MSDEDVVDAHDAAHCICDLCGRVSERLEIDHEHATDRIRGYVCRRCNFLLGVASDSPALLAAATAYLLNPPRSGSYKRAVQRRKNAWIAASPRQVRLRRESNARWRQTHRKEGGRWVKIETT